MTITTPLTYSTTALVREFHEKFGAPINTGAPTLDLGDRLRLRMDLIAEEFGELIEAVYGKAAAKEVTDAYTFAVDLMSDDNHEPDVVATADALGDLDYVIAGFALEAGIPHPDVVTEIHRSNLSKLGEDGKPILREDGKILKGPGYFRPDIAAVLGIDGARDEDDDLA